MRTIKLVATVAAALFFLCACVGGAPGTGTQENLPAEMSNPQTGEPYESPAFLDSEFHPEAAEVIGSAKIDVSALCDGYVAASARSDKRLKFQVISGEESYNYDLNGDGTPSVFPLSCGNGDYRFRVMENVTENRYAEIASVSSSVVMKDDFQPFLRPSDYVNYSEDSECVRMAEDLSAKAGTEAGMISAIYDFVCSSIEYDRQKAAEVESGYLSVPDETLRTGKGICFDYAALAAAMLRSRGIPTKLIFGYVSPGSVYHAWNMFYTAETGWVTVGFEARGGDWSRMDTTFAAGGASAEFVGDGTNYSDLYCY